ncbi:2-oxo acid dehydrogenase subunit E2 [Tsuneonella flava]|uniref:Dihydrolipoamide acetyltransferase component of pyruvate dehydrogenase complex n=1 Tax=Tsuneonella flava TaxID=2055955 RepID=A0ABX7KFK9_9SPHN|nr:dihydrolipoamide acetyltransferase family protein [Tsuneonella flava]QSB45790.1 2-oxo acid dehydrogenase subunit E2 [Tsuneonella flava]
MNIVMPSLGASVSEGKIVQWFKAVGDEVAAGEPLLEVESDKTSLEIEAPASGTLSEIRVAEDDIAPVGEIICILAGADEQPAETIEAPTPPPASPTAEPPRTEDVPGDPAPPPVRGRSQISPRARKLAAEKGIDLTQLADTGAPVTGADILAKSNAVPAADVSLMYADTPHQRHTISSMRGTIARRLTEAKQTIPHFYMSAEIDLGPLEQLRNELRSKAGECPTVTAFAIKAVAEALRAVPEANVVWAGDSILQFERADIAVAVALDDGLLTPVIRDAGGKTPSSISAELKDLAARARQGRLQPADYEGGVASISNLGMHGVGRFQAIINPPQALILALGASERRPREADDGSVQFVSQMTVTLSADHRVVDGVTGANLLAAFGTRLQAPDGLL